MHSTLKNLIVKNILKCFMPGVWSMGYVLQEKPWAVDEKID